MVSLQLFPQPFRSIQSDLKDLKGGAMDHTPSDVEERRKKADPDRFNEILFPLNCKDPFLAHLREHSYYQDPN